MPLPRRHPQHFERINITRFVLGEVAIGDWCFHLVHAQRQVVHRRQGEDVCRVQIAQSCGVATIEMAIKGWRGDRVDQNGGQVWIASKRQVSLLALK